MVETKVTRIGGTLYARIPAEEARKLGIHENSLVDITVKPLRRGVDAVLELRGKYKGRFAKDDDLWGDVD